MDTYLLQQLSPLDGQEGYDLLQRIGQMENDFTNPMHGKSYSNYRNWLVQQDEWSREENLPNGYVGQTCFWLVLNGNIVGLGKIRHGLTEHSRIEGGNIGIAIDPDQRGKGLAQKFIPLLLGKAKDMKVGEILITVKKFNYPSKIAFEKCGCNITKETDGWWYLSI